MLRAGNDIKLYSGVWTSCVCTGDEWGWESKGGGLGAVPRAGDKSEGPWMEASRGSGRQVPRGQVKGVPAVPAQVTWACLGSLTHGCSSTSQSCHSLPVHMTKGARACVPFWAPLAFPVAQSCGISNVGGMGWSGTLAAPPHPSARHTASAASLFQNAPHVGSQDCLIRTSTVPLQRLLPFTRRTLSCFPASARHQLKPLQVWILPMPGLGCGRAAARGPTADPLGDFGQYPDSGPQPFSLQNGPVVIHP